MVYGSRVARLAASFTDGLIIGIVQYVINKAVPSLSLITAFFGVIYFCVMTYHEGATFGKKIFGIKVVNDNSSQKLNFGTVLVREILGKFLSMIVIGLGYLWILFDAKRQGWHDKVAHTVVIEVDPLKGIKKIVAYILAGLMLLVPLFAFLAIIFSLFMLMSSGGVFHNNQLQQYQIQATPSQ